MYSTFCPKHLNETLYEKIEIASNRLHDKLKFANIRDLNISDYNTVYFEGKLKALRYHLNINSYILFWSLAKCDKKLEDIVLIDYGGGSGMISILAKELGIGTVIYNDIYDISCTDAKIIGKYIGNEADYYVNGDIGELINFVNIYKMDCDTIVSYDVIEHIYDINHFIKQLPLLINGSNCFSTCLASGANMYNPFYALKTKKLQQKIEFEGRSKKFGCKERDCYKAYFDVRKEIILNYLLDNGRSLTQNEIKLLAKNTRGLMNNDIISKVENYINHGIIPVTPSHPTNTCDPYTGNWAEHLMDPYALAQKMNNVGFKTQVLPGLFPGSTSAFKYHLSQLLNLFILSTEKLRLKYISLIFSPYYILYSLFNKKI